MNGGRLERMLGAAEPTGFDLEIGALNQPLLKKPQAQVLYVDYAPTEVVKANQFDPAVRLEDIVEVDIVWGERRLSEALGRAADFIMASHVIEHVPDLIGWLAELHETLRPGGVLGLAIPDKRFTLDALRRESSLAEAVEAHLLAYRRPSLRQVFDVASKGVAVDAGEVWRGRFRPAERRAEVLGRIGPALGLVRALHAAPQYRDAHCWVFTPASFLDLAEELATVGLFPYRVAAFHPTELGANEFQVRLAAAGPGEAEAIAASIDAARRALDGAAEPGSRDSPAAAPPRPEVVQEPPAALLALAEENRRLKDQLEALLSSTSWRAAAPLRSLKRLTRTIGWR